MGPMDDPLRALGIAGLADDYRPPPPSRWAQPWSTSVVTVMTVLGALIVGFLIARQGSAAIADYGGVQQVAPKLAGVFLVAGLAGLSLPGLAPFVSEFLVFVGTYAFHPVPAILAGAGVVLAALYILWMYQRTMTGPVPERISGLKDLSGREAWAVGPLIALILLFGVLPQPLLDTINPAVEQTMQQIDATDPEPAIGQAADEQEGASE
jgi:NADH-quinone oxidoreductase subunit M